TRTNPVSPPRLSPQPLSANPTPPPAQPTLTALTPVTNVLVASQFEKLPVDRLTNGLTQEVRLSGFFILAHRWREGQLWLDCRYELSSPYRGHIGFYAVLMAWNPLVRNWDVIPYHNQGEIPRNTPVGFMGPPETALHFDICNGFIYVSAREE